MSTSLPPERMRLSRADVFDARLRSHRVAALMDMQ